jgi:hypothetical protein
MKEHIVLLVKIKIQKERLQMKTKKIYKKLLLNKKTIADLNMGEMKNLHGGGNGNNTGNTCFPCIDPPFTEQLTCTVCTTLNCSGGFPC